MRLKVLITHPNLIIEVIGHTDNAGSPSYNLDLSIKRAQNVTKYLIQKGVQEKQLSYSGKGDTAPIETNGTAWGREKNRRVEIKVIKR